MNKVFCWGVIGPGKISQKFAETMTVIKGAKILAVASRSTARAQAFAEKIISSVFTAITTHSLKTLTLTLFISALPMHFTMNRRNPV